MAANDTFCIEPAIALSDMVTEATWPEIIVTVRSGVIQDISSIPEGVTVKVVDFDTDGVDEDRLESWEEDGSTLKAVVSEW